MCEQISLMRFEYLATRGRATAEQHIIQLRAPLTLILGPAAELREAQLSNSLHGHVLIIDRNARRLLRLVRSIPRHVVLVSHIFLR